MENNWTTQHHTAENKSVYDLGKGVEVVHDWTTRKAYTLVQGEHKRTDELFGVGVQEWEKLLIQIQKQF